MKFSEEQYKDFVDNASDMIQCVDKDGRFCYVNLIWKEKLGYIEDEIKLLTLWDVVHPDFRVHCEDVFRKLMLHEKIDFVEVVFIAKDGNVIYVKGNINCRFDDKGNFVSTRGIFRDISIEKLRELEILKYKKLVEEKAELQLLLSDAIVAFIDVEDDTFDDLVKKTLEKFGNYVSADRTYIFEYKLDEGTCNNVYEWCNYGIEPQIGELQNLNFEIIRNWVDDHMAGKTINIADVFNLPGNDGVKNILEKQGIKSLIALPMIKNNICYGFVGFDSVKKHHTYTQDEQHILFELGSVLLSALSKMKITRALRESEASKLTLIESIQDIIFVIDNNLIFRECYAPKSELLYIQPELLIGKHIDDIEFPDSAMDIIRATIETVLKSGEPGCAEYYLNLPDGRFWFDLQIAAILGKEGFSKGVVCTIRDITTRIEMEKVLRLSEENFRIFFETMDDLVFVWNQQYEACYTNSVASKKLGYTSAEMKNMNIMEFYPKDKQNESKNILKNLIEGKRAVCPIPLVTKNGDYLPVETRLWIGTWDGIKCIFTVSKDLSKEQEALQKFNSLFDNNPSLMAVSMMESRILTEVNSTFVRILGYSKEEVIGKTSQELNIFCENEVENKFSDELRKNGKIGNFEMRVKCKNGKILYGLFFGETIESQGKKYFLTVMTDITYRKRMEDEIYIEKELFKTTLLSVGDGVISTDDRGNVMVMNRVAEKLTGWEQEEALGKHVKVVFNVIDENSGQVCENLVQAVLLNGANIKLGNQNMLISNTEEDVPIEYSIAPIKASDGKVTGAVIVFRDFTEKKGKQKEIEYLSFNDYLTGLYNRRYMEDALKRMDNYENLPLAIMALDVNGLKLTNDAFGHEMGDKLLRTVGDILKKSCRSKDVICRVGGDEFIILLPKTDEAETDKIKEEIIDVATRMNLDSVMVSLAVGYAVKTSCDEDIESIKNSADSNMYKNKVKYGKIMRSKTVETIIRSINNNYVEEQTHTERVSRYCEAIARKLNFDEKDVEHIKMAGVLHDIGKIILPSELLNKSEKLTEEEYELIKKHPETGYQILKSVNEYSSIAELILYHHERYDGKGYPGGLRGEEIPFESRIITVADAYEAMTAKRPYQRTKTKNEAIEELKRCSGTQFDPKIVKLFIEEILQ